MRGRLIAPLACLSAGLILFLGFAPATPIPPAQAGPQDKPAPRPAAPTPAPSASLQYDVSVTLKLIHVYVTDRSGKPVVDLTRDDFSLTDDGHPVKLTEFEKHALEAPSEKAAPSAVAAPAEAPAGPAASLEHRRFFLLFDFAYNNARGLVKARKAALHFLDSEVRPGDEVAVLTYSAIKGVVVRQYLTNERGKVRDVVEQIDSKKIAGRATEAEDRYWRLVEAMGGEDTTGTATVASEGADDGQPKAGRPSRDQSGTMLWELRAQRDESKRMAETFIFKLTALAKALRLISGQKQFILFSTGIPYTVMYGHSVQNTTFRDKPGSTAGDRDVRTHNEEMNREFAAAGCSFFTFDTRESAEVASLFTYDETTFAAGSRNLFSAGGESQGSNSVFRDTETTGQNTLKRISDITGGKYYSNINLFEKNLGEVQRVTGTYYVLGYAIGQPSDGRFHEVKVDVKRPGCVVKAQSGYYASKPYAQYSDLEKQLHLFDLALNDHSPFRMAGDFSMQTLCFPLGADCRAQVVARIPAEVTRRFAGSRIEFFAIAFDGNGDIAEVKRLQADPRLHRGQTLVFSSGLALKPGDYDFRLVIRDMETGLSAVGSTRSTVAQPAASGLRLCTPLFLVEEAGMPVMDAGPGARTDAVTWKDVYPFNSLAYSVAPGVIPREHKRVAVLLPFVPAAGEKSDVVFSAAVVDTATGRPAAAEITLVGTSRGPAMETAEFDLSTERLKPGRYLLYLYAQDAATKSLAHAMAGFTISADGGEKGGMSAAPAQR